MTAPALHTTTAIQLTDFIATPSHAVLLTGATGIGKRVVAEYLADTILKHSYKSLNEYPYARVIVSGEGKMIGIEAIRDLEHFLSLKVPGSSLIKRVIIIDQAQLLGLEAQNALLKTLEEPPVDTIIIMTAPSVQSLLPTIQSRLQTIAIIKPAKSDLASVMPSTAFDANYTISGGLPGLLHALINNQDHPLTAAVVTARQLLVQSGYERLLQVDTLAKDKQLTQNTLSILQQMAHISLQSAKGPASMRWQGIMKASYQASEALAASGNAKLVLTNLLIQL
jgi:DNA polymerase III delta prime subunit